MSWDVNYPSKATSFDVNYQSKAMDGGVRWRFCSECTELG